MGSSFVRYGEYGFWSRDAFVESWLQRFVAEVDALGIPAEWLTRARRHWHIQGTAGFIGCIDCAFDHLLSEPAHRDLAVEVALRVCDQDGMTRGEAATAELFLMLLRGEIRTTAGSPQDYLARD